MTGPLPWPTAYTVSSDDCRTPVPLGYQAPFAEAAECLAELGYTGLEVQVRRVSEQDAPALTAAADAAGVRILAVGTGPVAAQDRLTLTDPAPDVRRHALDRLLGAARLAGALGVPLTLGQARGRLLPGLEDMQRTWAERAVRRLADEVRAHDGRLLLEPQNRETTSLWNTPEDALAFAAGLDARTGLVLDTFHLEAEGLDVLEAVRAHAPVTGCVQLAAPTGRGPLGVGDHRLPGLLRGLRQAGFTGWLTLEHTQDGDSPRAAARSWTALDDAAAPLTRPPSPLPSCPEQQPTKEEPAS
ncbi:sugar phosphate isomerase/epimerase family protein [Streptomyces sp. NPDC096132]|uniref:sugar phosphate isomerase/epimerase family protein n=1 Tax=Streptomyces sp. NPDC096132 TaxID=3366075 RepID=UPI0038289C14